MSVHSTIPTLLLAASLAFTSCDSKPSATAQAEPEGDHESSATVQVHHTQLFGSETIEPSQNFLANQVAIFSTANVLKEAAHVTTIDVQTIKSSLLVKPVEGTDLVTITARHDHEETAERIVDAIVESYISTRNRRETEIAKRSLDALDDELQRQADVVQERRKALTILVQQYGIPYFEGRDDNPVGLTEEAMYLRAREKLADLEQQRDLLEIQIRKVLKTDSNDLIRTAAGLELPDNRVAALYSEYLKTMGAINKLEVSGMGSNHPENQKLQKQAAFQLQNAEREVNALKEVLKTRLNLIDRQVERMREMVSEKKSHAVDLSMQQHQYNVAREEYEQARDLLNAMKIKQQEARVLLRMPRTPLTVHSRTK